METIKNKNKYLIVLIIEGSGSLVYNKKIAQKIELFDYR